MEEFHTFETQCQLKSSLTVDTAQHHLSAVLMASCLAAALLPLLPASRPLCVAHISCSAPDPITITPARGGNVSLLRRDIARQWAIRDNFSEAQARPRANIGLYDYALPPPSPLPSCNLCAPRPAPSPRLLSLSSSPPVESPIPSPSFPPPSLPPRCLSSDCPVVSNTRTGALSRAMTK